MPVSDVAANSAATSSWANSVADAIQELEGDLYPAVYGQLAIPWASITGKPATFPATAHAASHGSGGADPVPLPWASITGKPTTFAPTAHAASHGSAGADAVTPAAIGAATAVHASRHYTGGADPLTAANIGAAAAVHSHTASSVGAWAKGSQGGGAAGTTVWVGTTTPAAPAEGDVWIKG